MTTELQITGYAARYPFLSEGRQTIQETDVSMADVFADDTDTVTRATERVELALREGRVGAAAWDARDELLSYPAARVLVSLLADREPTAVEAYAAAEAATFRERADGDIGSDRQERSAIDFAEALHFDASVADAPGTYQITVGDYLANAPDEDGWALADRPLAEGRVRVEHGELLTLLEHAARDAIADGLPYEVPDTVANHARDALGTLEPLVERAQPPTDFEVVRPGELPPCLSATLEAMRANESVPPPLEASLLTALRAAGMDREAISDLLGGSRSPEAVGYLVERFAPEGDVAFHTPACDAIDDYGWCDPDDDCDRAPHPYGVYAQRVDE